MIDEFQGMHALRHGWLNPRWKRGGRLGLAVACLLDWRSIKFEMKNNRMPNLGARRPQYVSANAPRSWSRTF